MALNFFRPGTPNDQPPADLLPTAKLAISVAVLNAGITSLSYLQPCHGGGEDDCYLLEKMYYDLYRQANFVTAMLGVALLVVDTAAVFRSPAWAPAIKWTVWVTKVLTGVTLTYSLSVLYSCLRMCAWPLFDWLSHGFYHHFLLTATIVFLCNLAYFYSVYCSELNHV